MVSQPTARVRTLVGGLKTPRLPPLLVALSDRCRYSSPASPPRGPIAARQILSGLARRGAAARFGRAEGFARRLSVIPEEPPALVMGGRNVMTGHFKGDSPPRARHSVTDNTLILITAAHLVAHHFLLFIFFLVFLFLPPWLLCCSRRVASVCTAQCEFI